MPNIKTDFSITGRYIQGFEIVGYFAIDNKTSKERLLKTQDIIKLAKLKRVNAECIECDGKEYLYIADESKIENIFESKNKMSLMYKLIDKNSKLTGYMCKDENNKNYKISPEQLWELAFNGAVSNVQAILCGEKKALVGKGININDITSIEDQQ